jgi:hypothetical protein
LKEQIEQLIQRYRGQIKSGRYCSCRAACNCDDNIRYTNDVYRKIIEDLQKVIDPPSCLLCRKFESDTFALIKFESTAGTKIYICSSCKQGGL